MSVMKITSKSMVNITGLHTVHVQLYRLHLKWMLCTTIFLYTKFFIYFLKLFLLLFCIRYRKRSRTRHQKIYKPGKKKKIMNSINQSYFTTVLQYNELFLFSKAKKGIQYYILNSRLSTTLHAQCSVVLTLTEDFR